MAGIPSSSMGDLVNFLKIAKVGEKGHETFWFGKGRAEGDLHFSIGSKGEWKNCIKKYSE